MHIREAAEVFKERLHLEPPMKFDNARLFDLSPHVRGMTKSVLEPLGIKWKLGEFSHGGFYCIQVADEWAPYLIIGHDSYMWCNEGMQDSIRTDEVYIYLMKKYAGIDAEIDPVERNVILKKDGKILQF